MKGHKTTKRVLADRSVFYCSSWIQEHPGTTTKIAAIIRVDTGDAGLQIDVNAEEATQLIGILQQHIKSIAQLQAEWPELEVNP
jgi:hypothetical protein